MSSFRPVQSALIHCLPAALMLFALSACESDHAERSAHPSDPAAAAADKPVPEMEAHGTFFSGQIEMETLLNRTGFAGRGGGDSGSSSGTTSDDSGSGGGGARGGGHRRGGGSGPSSTAGSGGDSDSTPHFHPSNLPAVRLHLRLTNHGPIPVKVEVIDFNSDLGNFVVEPAEISLLPNQPVEAEPMTSELGVSSDAIPLTVTLQINDQIEKQVLVLHKIPPPTPPSPPPNPAP